MKRMIFNVSVVLYICAAIVVASASPDSRTPFVAVSEAGRAKAEACLGSTPTLADLVRGTYPESAKIIVWSIPGCSGCVTFKRNQLPILIEAGVYTGIYDAAQTPPEDKTITSYPTIILFDGDNEIQRWVGDTPAATILQAIPVVEETPDYKIWDNIKRWLNF